MAVWQEVDSFDAERGTLRTWITVRPGIALDKQLCYADAKCIICNLPMKIVNGPAVIMVQLNTFRRGVYDNDSRITLSPHSEASMESLLEQGERREELRLALATLPELDRYLIIQRYFKFASTEELATKTGLTRHAVDTRLWRARKSLRETLKEHSHEYERI